jgi:hypothetical protein
MRGAWRLQSTVRIPASVRTASNAAVQFDTIADHELDLTCLLAEVHEEVAGLLGGPFPGGIQGDPTGDADVPGGVLDHGQDISLGIA